jgi:glycosyltransferase involved in cell wall biosynthesis
MEVRSGARNLAIVIPWFGRDLKGGAEQQAWQIASRLAQRGYAVEVLTTCCRSHQDDWATNHLPAGVIAEPEGFSVRRFPVDERDRAAFDQVCGHLLSLEPAALQPGVSPISADESKIFTTELIKSVELLNFLTVNNKQYGSLIFLPYLFGPVLRGIAIVGSRAAFQPCLHDEAYAYLPEVAEAFYRCGQLLFNSEGEQELAARLFGPGIWSKSTVVGEGVEVPLETRTASSPPLPNEDKKGRYIFYLGRKDAGKNIDLLVHAFRRFRAVRPNSDLRLLLAGHGMIDLDGCRNSIEDLGLVSDREKGTLLRDCLALAQPSEKESFSRVMMEAWLYGRPVAVHSRCLATSIAVRQAGGGWLAGEEKEWAQLFVELDRMPPAKLGELGENGRRYAGMVAEWDQVIDRYERALLPDPLPQASTSGSFQVVAFGINQFLPNLTYGDAISNQAIFIRDSLRASGYLSEIYALHIDPRVAHECQIFSAGALHASSAIIYHHSIGSEITPQILNYRGPACLIYHNITPAQFFDPYWPEFAAILRRGREDLPRLAAHFRSSFGGSSFNAQELSDCGFHNPGVLPISVSPDKWALVTDTELMRELQDGRTNLLFVGRISPNKKQDDLIHAFKSYLSLDPTARLALIGKAEENDPYAAHLMTTIRALRLEGSVSMRGSISDKELAAYYRTAHLFWSMSEHEGFCVPIVEAMWFDVPVLAFRSSAVPETLGRAALIFTDKRDLCEVAVLARILVTDGELRGKIIAAQRKRRQAFLPQEIELTVAQIAQQLSLAVEKP